MGTGPFRNALPRMTSRNLTQTKMNFSSKSCKPSTFNQMSFNFFQSLKEISQTLTNNRYSRILYDNGFKNPNPSSPLTRRLLFTRSPWNLMELVLKLSNAHVVSSVKLVPIKPAYPRHPPLRPRWLAAIILSRGESRCPRSVHKSSDTRVAKRGSRAVMNVAAAASTYCVIDRGESSRIDEL